ncbi:MAG TPA: substrate-binding domain-containing protein [Tenuifilaceae bacterium]|nr:substrate-binding domain-containing protein [Tenuifilaceae bacterium]
MGKISTFKQVVQLAILAVAIVAVLPACKNKGAKVPAETPTSGSIKIEADESFKPIVDAEVSTFTSLYNLAHIQTVYKPERELIVDFLNDSVQVIVSSWTPTEEQRKTLLDAQTVVRTTLVAYDALAIVLNKGNNDSLLTYDNVKDIFTGKITDWNQLNTRSKLGKISIIFDNIHSGNIRYFREKFNLPQQLPPNFYAVNSNAEVVNYVAKSPGALGIVSVNWISDTDDSTSFDLGSKVKLAAISQQYFDKDSYYLPVQGSIYQKTYPFIREVNINSRESFYGLGSGFISFVAGEKGQRIILKSGLVPATMPIRIVEVKNE